MSSATITSGFSTLATLNLPFDLEQRHLATEPPEASGRRRDDVRLLVSRGNEPPVHSRFREFASFLEPGDLAVVNTSGTRAAAVDATLSGGEAIVIHVSTELPGGLWMVEPRRRIGNGSTEPLRLDPPETTVATLTGGARLRLLQPAPASRRLWLAAVIDDGDLAAVLAEHGRPIRYSYVDRDWPIEDYQTVFSNEPGSAEMPSAARPFTDEIVSALIRRGVGIASITLHTGVSSLEGDELPYAEQFTVSAPTAAIVNATHASDGHVIAVGTTVVRALETATDAHGTVHPASGLTDTVITPARGVRAVDGLLTGWHEPRSSHLAMLEAIGGRDLLLDAYVAAWDAGYLWHEFGDSHLLVPYAGGDDHD